MMIHRIAFVFAAMIGCAPAATAQFVVRVESAGVGVFDAEVAVWSDSGRLALGRTDGTGVVRLPLSREKTPIAFVTARRVGFSPGRISMPAADSVTVWLTQRTTELRTVAVTARPLRCPAKSDEEAMTLWHRAAARYAAGQDTMPWSYVASFAEETVPGMKRGYGEPLTERRQNGGRSLGSVTGSRYYGSPLAFMYGTYHPPFGPSYGKWVYPVMFGSAAGSFASSYFGEHHTFVVLGHSGDATTIGFCATSRAEPEIEGELEVSSDTLLLGARWSFRVPHDDEDAGGEATFGESRLDGARYLVAVSTATWRRVRPRLYEQERLVLDGWKFGHTDLEARLESWTDRGDRSGVAPPHASPPN
jgi:hypothetical protein